MKTKPATETDLRHKLRAQLVQLYEAAAGIEYPKESDTAYRAALAARIQAGVAGLAREHTATDADTLIATAQDVRLYKASAAVKNPDVGELAFRVSLQRRLGAHFRLGAALDARRAAAAKGGA
ncbi:MAG: hypothetical protein LBI02_03785 [Opitutaceae bacterium]|jgi:hypothetical protein|nr:hypothetical protein [Opitutaceae bacterium]